MRKAKNGTIELDVEDKIAVEDAIIAKFENLAKTNDSETKERLKRIYHEMVCARVFIKN